MFVLDTNTISYFFRQHSGVVERLRQLTPSQVGVPAIVEYELRYGLLRLPEPAREPRLAALARFLAPLAVLPFDTTAAAQAASIRCELEQRGQPIGPNDLLIAATALVNGATLVSRNVREFSRVPGLTVVDWHGE